MQRTTELLDRLGYLESPSFLASDMRDFNTAPDYGHLFRDATKDPCNLKGVYSLDGGGTQVPLVYVCEANSEQNAQEAHRLIWNQGIVPFVITVSPETIRVYPGFCHTTNGRGAKETRSIQEQFNSASLERIVQTLDASAINSGDVWRQWGQFIRPQYRIDGPLLSNLSKLDERLRGRDLAPHVSHSLIGKYVYLRYLQDRGILSNRKFDRFGIDPDCVFGRNATLEGLRAICSRLDEWLNGGVFPIAFDAPDAPSDSHVSQVASVFKGDAPLGTNDTQLHLDFQAYDFSYIPIELLSVVYEQFLHSGDGRKKGGRGREAGAFYTPIPVVNFMLSEIEEHRPLERGMRIFDPACGSGAFLVQAYRRLIEKEFPPDGAQPKPVELRELLTKHIFGLDTDKDACNVTRFSLLLTLLDYVNPPDLEPDGTVGRPPQLPGLEENIFEDNFFSDEGKWFRKLTRKKADWIIGNPPWKPLTKENLRSEDMPVLEWIERNEKQRPVGNVQAGRAFAWRVADFLTDDGEVALLLPAMSLFAQRTTSYFRREFFQQMNVHTVANFSNLRHLISGGRFEMAAAAFFYCPRDEEVAQEGYIRTYTPLLANQEVVRPSSKEAKTVEAWSLVLNASEIRDIPVSKVLSGNSLPWKLAQWGSGFDAKLLSSVSRRFETIRDMEARKIIIAGAGPEFRAGDPTHPPKGMSARPDLLGRQVLCMNSLEGLRNFFSLPLSCMHAHELPIVRRSGGIIVCEPPHVLVSAARTFAVFSDEFVIVPPRQIGIMSPKGDKAILKAIALYLNSDFAYYYDFLCCSELGIGRDRSTLNTLRGLPVPFGNMAPEELRPWVKLHDQLSAKTEKAFREAGLWGTDAISEETLKQAFPKGVVGEEYVEKINNLTCKALDLSEYERALVEDMLHVRLALNDGQLGDAAIRVPSRDEFQQYAYYLRDALDVSEFSQVGRHAISLYYKGESGIVRIEYLPNESRKQPCKVQKATEQHAILLETCQQRVRRECAQWVYFDRNLRIYDGDCTYLFKPLQRFQWTRTQARLDAQSITADAMDRRNCS